MAARGLFAPCGRPDTITAHDAHGEGKSVGHRGDPGRDRVRDAPPRQPGPRPAPRRPAGDRARPGGGDDHRPPGGPRRAARHAACAAGRAPVPPSDRRARRKGVVTEFSPEHHPHQTGLYWGFTRVNGRDLLPQPPGRLLAPSVGHGHCAEPATRFGGRPSTTCWTRPKNAILTETERWSMREEKGRFLLDLEWRGEAKNRRHDRQVRLRRPVPPHALARGHARPRWSTPRASATSAPRASARCGSTSACRSRAATTSAHVAMFDHPDNAGYPQAWRVDGQFGVGVGALARRPTGRSRRARPRSSAIASSSTPARSTTSR